MSNEIRYTSTDEHPVIPNSPKFGQARIIANTYVDGQGVIEFDDDINIVPRNAFSNCIRLVSVIIPDTVTTIEERAFSDCSSLTLAVLPDSVVNVGGYAYERCSSLASAHIGSSVSSIDGTVFSDCPELATITVGQNNQTFDSRGECNAIVETSTNVLVAGCNTTIMPNDVTAIGPSAFMNRTELTAVAIPEGVTTVGRCSFRGCAGLAEITIPDTVTVIDDGAFNSCTSLESVIIPDSVVRIGYYAFFNCSNLVSVTFGTTTSIPTIGTDAFRDVAPTGTVYGQPGPDHQSVMTQFPSEWVLDAARRQPDNEIWYTTTDGGIITPDEAGFGETNIVANTYDEGFGVIVFDGTLTTIGGNAFEGCDTLISVTIPNSVTDIAENAFAGVVNVNYNGSAEGSPWGARLANGFIEGDFVYTDDTKTTLAVYIGDDESVTIPYGVGTIADGVFDGYDSITTVVIPDSVTAIGDGALSGVANAEYDGTATGNPWGAMFVNDYVEGDFVYSDDTKVVLVGYIGDDSSVTIPDGVTDIGEHAFYGNEDIEAVVIPKTVENIGSMAFGDCGNLASVTVDPNNASFDSRDGSNAVIETATGILVAGCNGTEIPDGVVGIGSRAFFKCGGLESVTLPDTVTLIGDAAFYKCTGLMSITCMAANPPAIGLGMLDDTNDCPIYVPAVSVSKYKKAAGWKSYASRIKAISC